MGLFVATIFSCYAMLPKPRHSEGTVGLDFIAFYTAGTFVREGRATQMYDLHEVKVYQHDLAKRHGVDIGDAVGPWWNPPFYAWLFVPFSRMSYPVALRWWLALNVTCGLVAVGLLTRLVAATSTGGWKQWALVPAFVFMSTPFIYALSHAQNTCTSLLILTLAVLAWRSERAMLAGLLVGLMGYKPQLAAVVACAMTITLGWRALLGAAVTGTALLLVTVLTLPGTLPDYLHRLPQNLHYVMTQTQYLWDRHATFRAFWRLLLQGMHVGPDAVMVRALTLLCTGILGGALLWATFRTRANADRNAHAGGRYDRIIIATIAATPLVMPFYFDYDQLLLAVPLVLFTVERMQENKVSSERSSTDVWLMRLWPAWYVWLMVNPDVAGVTRVNGTVILLSAVASLLTARAWQRKQVTTLLEPVYTERLAAAA